LKSQSLRRELANEIISIFFAMSGSQTIHSLFKTEELVLENQWLEIRDIFFGHNNNFEQDITRALELAAACPHKEARWLTRVVVGKSVSTAGEARDVFLALGENDARGLCFAVLLSKNNTDDENDEDVALMRRSAELGCALAQTKMAVLTSREEGFRFATLAASQREREGFYCLGSCFNFGLGCEKSLDKAKENFLIAAELGHVKAMLWFGDLLEESDPLRWVWWAQGAKRGESYDFRSNFAEQVQQFESGSCNAAVVFQIGRTLNGNVDLEKRTLLGISGVSGEFDRRIRPANSAISFYKSQLSACCRAVDAWSHVGLRFKVVKDIRVLIGKMIWETRELALFENSGSEP
jgi:hypothetical protein